MRKLRDANGKFRLNRKAVSPVIAVLLMIAIAVAAAILVYVWSMGLIGTLQSGGGQQVREQIMMDDYTWPDDTTGLTLYLRNVGSSTVTVDAIYIEGVQATSAAALTISIQSLTTISGLTVTGVTLTNGAAYTIKVITLTGGVFTFSCILGHGA